MAKPPVNFQGKFIVEPNSGGDCLIMSPDGRVQVVDTPLSAIKAIRRECKRISRPEAFNMSLVEWRGGLKPPEE